MAIVVSPAAEVTVLSVGWPVYEALLAGTGERAHSLLAYDGHLLEIVSPSAKHEIYNRLLEALVREVGREWKIDLLGSGSTTLKIKPRGAEADSSFYIGQRAALMRRRDDADLEADCAPDIVVEIDISRARIDKKALYAALGVPEFWRYDGQRLRAFDLQRAGFPEIELSARLGCLPLAELDRFLEMRHDVSHPVLADLWQQWLRENRPL